MNRAKSQGPTGASSSADFDDFGTFPLNVIFLVAFSLAIRILCLGAIFIIIGLLLSLELHKWKVCYWQVIPRRHKESMYFSTESTSNAVNSDHSNVRRRQPPLTMALYHWAEVKAKMYLMNLGKPTKVAKLNEQMAIELGASLMGEVIIFTVAGGCLILEYNRQVAKEARKEGDRQAQLQKFADDITNLHQLSQQQAKQLEYLTHVIEEIAKKTKHKINLQEVKSSSYLADSSDSTKEHSRNSVNNVSIKKNNADDSDDKSVVRRAIVYYENDVKGKFS